MMMVAETLSRWLEPIAQWMRSAVRGTDLGETFFESDIYSRSTAVYVWAANQFGHFAIGIVLLALPALLVTVKQHCYRLTWSVLLLSAIGLLLFSLKRAGGASPVPAITRLRVLIYLASIIVVPLLVALWVGEYAPVLVLLVALLHWMMLYNAKEVADWLREKDEVEARSKKGSAHAFDVDARAIADDSITDSGFVLLGILSGFLTICAVSGQGVGLAPTNAIGNAEVGLTDVANIVVAAVSLALALFLWTRYRRSAPGREAFDLSGLPNFVRMQRFNGKMQTRTTCSGADDDTPGHGLKTFLSNHCLRTIAIAANGKSGKTFLACAMACEAIDYACRAERRSLAIRYVTWRQLDEGTAQKERSEALEPCKAELLVIDDIPSGVAIKDRVLPHQRAILVFSERLPSTAALESHIDQCLKPAVLTVLEESVRVDPDL